MNSPEEAALARERAQVMQDRLAALPEGQRRVVELRLVGLSAPDIAEVFGMSVSAVKVAQWRAFKRLRDLLDGEDESAGGQGDDRCLTCRTGPRQTISPLIWTTCAGMGFLRPLAIHSRQLRSDGPVA